MIPPHASSKVKSSAAFLEIYFGINSNLINHRKVHDIILKAGEYFVDR